MTVAIITGGGGFLGQCLATSLLSDPNVCLQHEGEVTAITKIVLADVAFPPTDQSQPLIAKAIAGGTVECRAGSVAEKDFCTSLISSNYDTVSVFHLGAVMSGTGEADFDLCMQVNLFGTMHMLEAARSHPSRVKFIYASAGATIGSGAPQDWIQKDDVISDSARATPHTTYGMTKSCGELLLADYSRRSFIDGRGARLPTVVVRAGSPNAATTGCFSGVVREPLAGVDAVMPIAPDVKHAVTGVKNVVHALRKLHDVSSDRIDAVLGYDRTVFLPATALSLSELEVAMKRVVEPSCNDKLGKVTYEVDDFLSNVVGGFPTKIDAARAIEIGCIPAPTAEEVVRDYAEAFAGALAPGLKLVSKDGETTTDAETSAADSSNNIVAVISGAGSGIGRAVSLKLAKGGWGPREGLSGSPNICLVLVGRRREPLQETAALCEKEGAACLIAPCDVTKEESIAATFDRTKTAFGRVDLLFNNAGTNIGATSVVDFDLIDFRRIIAANLTGSFLCAKEAMKMMKTQTPMGGRIINNGSISAQVPRPGGCAYTCSKFGVTGLTKTLALEGREFNIPVGQVDFGNVQSAVSALTQSGGALQPDGTSKVEPQFYAEHAASSVFTMAALPLEANALQMTVLATKMPFVGRG